MLGTPIVAHGTTYQWVGAMEADGVHTDSYATASGAPYALTATGPVSAPVASVVGAGPGGGFVGFFDGTYFDAVTVVSIANLSQTINGHSYTGTTRTTTTSIAADDSGLEHITNDAYVGASGTITISTNNAGEVSVSGAENGYFLNGAWHLTGPVATAPFAPITILGKLYTFHHGSYHVTYTYNGSSTYSGYSEDDVFLAPDAGTSASFVAHLDAPQVASGWIQGNDPSIGSFTAPVGEGIVGEVTATRTAPSLAPMHLWHYLTPITWVDGWVVGSGMIVDYYSDPDGACTMTIVGNPDDFLSGGSQTAQVSVTETGIGGVHTGDYFGVTGQFAVSGFELQARNGSRNRAGAKYWVNGAEYLWAYGYESSNGSGFDQFENPSLGSLNVSWDETGERSVDVSYSDWRFTGPYQAGVSLPAGGIGIEILEQSTQLAGAPPAFWVNGLLFWRTSPTAQTYTSGDDLIVISGGAGQLVLYGYGSSLAFQGSYNGSPGAFSVTDNNGATRPAYPANLDGSAQLAAVPPPPGFPPAIYLSNAGTFQYLGTRSGGNACYGYAGPLYSDYSDAKPMILEIDSNGNVTLTGRGGLANGVYHATVHLFQSTNASNEVPLGMPLYGVDPLHNNRAWGLQGAPSDRPQTIVVEGRIWRYIGMNAGLATYWGYLTGQEITIGATAANGSAPVAGNYNGTPMSGSYRGGVFTLTGAGSGLSVLAGNAAGRVVAATGAAQVQTISGDLDITGSVLSLGAWGTDPGMAGLTVQYTDNSTNALIGLTGSRPKTSFLFSEGPAPSRPLMRLEATTGQLLLYPPTGGATPKITLDPAGTSEFTGAVQFKGAVRVPRQGDISMGGFESGTRP